MKDSISEPMSTERTVLVYMATHNDLSYSSAVDMEEIKSGYLPRWYDSGRGNVLLVYRHGLNGNPVLMRVSEENGRARVDSLVKYPRQNSCEDSTFRKVLKDAFGSFPSTERGLILSSHGSGWVPPGYYANPVDYYLSARLGISQESESSAAERTLERLPVIEIPNPSLVKSFGKDDYGSTEMDIDTLRNALTYHLDYLVFDSCLMGGVEVAFQMRECCDYIVASQAEVLNDGFPYSEIMSIAFGRGGNVASRSKGLAEKYYNYYNERSGSYRSATISVVKTSELPRLASSVKAILYAGGRQNTDTLSLSRGELKYVQGYFRYGHHWFYDMDDYIAQVCPDEGLYSAFSEAMDNAVIYKAATPYVLDGMNGFPIRHFSGLSTYVSRSGTRYLNDYYSSLDWGMAIGF
ncbi:MAG: hypothetical protein KBS57_05225 [Alistipes sp.]|nr:hypothetical protein [Candidatus Minthomonas equi]